MTQSDLIPLYNTQRASSVEIENDITILWSSMHMQMLFHE